MSGNIEEEEESQQCLIVPAQDNSPGIIVQGPVSSDDVELEEIEQDEEQKAPEEPKKPGPKFTTPDKLCVAIGLQVFTICCFAFSLGSEWTYREDSEVATHFSLLRVRRGPENLEGMGFDCFNKVYCGVDEEGGLCQVYSDMTFAGLWYLLCEFLSIVFLVFMTERLIYMYIVVDFARAIVTYVFAGISVLLHLLAIFVWFGQSKQTWGADCSSPPEDLDDAIAFCLTSGPAIAIISTVSIFVSVPFALYCYWHRNVRETDLIIRLQNNKVMYVDIRVYYAIITALMLISLFLSIGSLTTENWVQRTELPEFKGGLYTCKDCDDQTEYIGWDCYTSKFCAKSTTGMCETFQGLSDAANIYGAMSGGFYFLFIIWLQNMFFLLIRNRQYGVPSLNYIVAFLVMLIQMLGTLGWFQYSRAAFFASCEEEEETEITARPSICATDGPGMALGSVPPLIIACFLFFLVYPKRLKRRSGWSSSNLAHPEHSIPSQSQPSEQSHLSVPRNNAPNQPSFPSEDQEEEKKEESKNYLRP